jgi:hypothetical protein
MNKEGCGRVLFWTEIGLVHSYTLECNYQTGKRLNHLNPRVDSLNNNYRMPEPPMKDIHSKVYQESRVSFVFNSDRPPTIILTFSKTSDIPSAQLFSIIWT